MRRKKKKAMEKQRSSNLHKIEWESTSLSRLKLSWRKEKEYKLLINHQLIKKPFFFSFISFVFFFISCLFVWLIVQCFFLISAHNISFWSFLFLFSSCDFDKREKSTPNNSFLLSLWTTMAFWMNHTQKKINRNHHRHWFSEWKIYLKKNLA